VNHCIRAIVGTAIALAAGGCASSGAPSSFGGAARAGAPSGAARFGVDPGRGLPPQAAQPEGRDVGAMSPKLLSVAAADLDRQIVVTFRDARAGLVIEAGATPLLPAVGSSYRGSAYAGRRVRELAREYRLERVTDWFIASLSVHCVVYRVPDARAREALIEQLRADERVESVQPMQRFRTTGEAAPSVGARSASAPETAPATAPVAATASAPAFNDPYFPLQQAAGQLGVPQALGLARGRGVRVAVVDTGVDHAHADLAGRVDSVVNVVDNDATRFRRDRHGTAVAGAIAAAANNATGIVGVAPEARIVAVKACWETGDTAEAVCSSLSLAAGLEVAIEKRVQIINLSLSGPRDPLLERILAHAFEVGVLVIGADPAPGEGAASRPGFPGSVPGVLAVRDSTATYHPSSTAHVVRASLNGADASQALDERVVFAPGRDVLSLAPGSHYDYFSGASMATALVSGIGALLLEEPSLRRRPQAVPALLARTQSTAFDAAGDGAGLEPRPVVDACRALWAAHLASSSARRATTLAAAAPAQKYPCN
jgi:subtilisin family serine protease